MGTVLNFVILAGFAGDPFAGILVRPKGQVLNYQVSLILIQFKFQDLSL